MKYIRETYGVNWCDATFRRMLRDRLYTGYYERNGRVNENFCQPIISQELFDAVQKLLSNNAKSSPTGRVYLFTSLLVCAECGHRLAGYQARGRAYYRCNQHFQRGRCIHNSSTGAPKRPFFVPLQRIVHLPEVLGQKCFHGFKVWLGGRARVRGFFQKGRKCFVVPFVFFQINTGDLCAVLEIDWQETG